MELGTSSNPHSAETSREVLARPTADVEPRAGRAPRAAVRDRGFRTLSLRRDDRLLLRKRDAHCPRRAETRQVTLGSTIARAERFSHCWRLSRAA